MMSKNSKIDEYKKVRERYSHYTKTIPTIKRGDDNQIKFVMAIMTRVNKDSENPDYMKSQDKKVDDILAQLVDFYITNTNVDVYDAVERYLPYLMNHSETTRMQFVNKMLDEYGLL